MKRTTNPRELLCRIQVLNRQRRFKIDRAAVALFCADVLRGLDKGASALSIVFVNRGDMHAMNNKYLGHDYATDVLSFSYDAMPMEGCPFLGEIVVAPEVAALHAVRYRISPEKEIKRLLVHGILHLLGYNHETDRGRMNRLQAKLLRRKSPVHPSLLKGIKDSR